MADIGAGRPAQFAHHLRLERQQRQYMVNVAFHRACAAGTPSPYRRADVIDSRDPRRAGAHATRHAMSEFRTVDDDQHVGRGRHHRVSGVANAPYDFREARYDLDKTDDRKLTERKQAGHAKRRHLRAADTGKSRPGIAPPYGGDQRGSEPVARLLASHQKDMRAHRAVSAGVPMTKILARSAV